MKCSKSTICQAVEVAKFKTEDVNQTELNSLSNTVTQHMNSDGIAFLKNKKQTTTT